MFYYAIRCPDDLDLKVNQVAPTKHHSTTPKHQVLQRNIKVGQAGNTMLQQHGRQLFVFETPEDKEFQRDTQDGRIRG